MRGAFTDRAWHLLYKLKHEAVLMDYFGHRYKQPEYFNEDKYKLPMQCEKVADIPAKSEEYDAYRKMLERVKEKFDAISRRNASFNQIDDGKRQKQGKIIQMPFMELANAMLLSGKYRWIKVSLRNQQKPK